MLVSLNLGAEAVFDIDQHAVNVETTVVAHRQSCSRRCAF
jgi:hypothetical protein